MNYYISTPEGNRGPYTKQQLTRMWESGAVAGDTLYSAEGMTSWLTLEDLVAPKDRKASFGESEPLAASAGRVLGRVWGRLTTFAERAKERVRRASGSPTERAVDGAAGSEGRGFPLPQSFLIGIIVAAVILGFILTRPSTAVTSGSEARQTTGSSPPERNSYPETVERWLVNTYDTDLNEHKQAIFDALHLAGTATSVKVTGATVGWKPGAARREWEDISSYTVQFVLYWRGPITTDGYTQVDWTYDTVVERFTNYRIVQSNGITKDDVTDGLKVLAAGAIKKWAEE